jgi:phosphatidylserine/phosphatidylglycerophosphate/cardiolipin synthase-like enzyme
MSRHGAVLAGAVSAALLFAGCGASNPTTPASSPNSPSTTTTSGSTPHPTTAKSATKLPGLASRLRLISEPIQGIGPIYSLLASPRRTLDMTMYEFVDAAAENILVADAARGVVVRVILDRNRERSANTPAYDYLAAHGVHMAWAPTSYEATHEKAVVIDAGQPDAMDLIMTLNLTSRYYATTRDFALVDTDPSDVAATESVFNADYAGRSIVVSPGADLVWSPGSQPALVSLIDAARTSLDVENEEMTDPAVITALAVAAERGVRVDLTMTADSEWDQAFRQLEAAGVRVHLYPDTYSALYIHAKAIVSDGRIAFVGSENFSVASLDHNRELGIITSDPAVVSGVASVLAGDYARAESASTPTPAPTNDAAGPGAPACQPLSNEGTCYEPGEYCRNDDHGVSGVAGDGESITCKDTNEGWEWESPQVR